MKNTYVLAADLGGSGTKSMLYNLTLNRIEHSAFRPVELQHPEPDSVIQGSYEMLRSVVEGMKECIEESRVKGSDIGAIVFDGQQAGLIWIDKNYNAISPFDSWLDNRFVPFVSVMNNVCGNRILQNCGNNQLITTGAKMLWWKKNKPEIYSNAAKMVIPATYVGGKFAGLTSDGAYFENTSTGYTGLIDYSTDTWDREVCIDCGIDEKKLPKVVEPIQIVGQLCNQFAQELGIPSGIPIISGAGDFPAGGLGSGVLSPGQAGDISGTASLFFACSKDWKPDPEGLVRILRSPVKGYWYPFCFTNGGGCIKWFVDHFVPNADLKELTDKASMLPPGSEGLAFFPYIGGTTQDPNLGGAFVGIKWNHSQQHLYRAILESISFEYKSYLDAISKLEGISDFKEIRVFGGGSENFMWNQIKANVLGTKYRRMKTHDCSLLGSVIIAGKAIGFYDDLIASAQGVNYIENEFSSQSKSEDIYSKIYDRWSKFRTDNYAALRGI